MDDLCFLGAADLARHIRGRRVSCAEVMDAHLAQIERVNPHVNAVVTLLPERARAGARAADEALARGEAAGPLHGLPVAHKDLVFTKGIRTTRGSPVFADFVPDEDDLIVERLRQAGAITIGKTNTPEFGAGSQTFNPVFGATRNPYDLTKTCGGSSGGAAVALACGMVPIADGSDTGGSLRNPAAFCNVVGLRPSPGRVPSPSGTDLWSPLSVDGVLARSAEDLLLALAAISGPDPRAPLSLLAMQGLGEAPLARDFSGVRVAWALEIPGVPFDRRVTEVVARQRATVAAIGCEIIDGAPDFSGADEAFKSLRALAFAVNLGELVDRHGEQIKDTVRWNVAQGRSLTGPQLARAEVLRGALYQRALRFLGDYEYLLLPTTQVPPFDVTQPYISEINGVALETYLDWMRSCSYISVLGLPAASVPCGFTEDGLPVGLQIVGRPGADLSVLQLAHAFEGATGFGRRRPPVVL